MYTGDGNGQCPTWTPFLGFMGAASCLVLANWGAAIGTWRSGIGLCKMGVDHPHGIVKNLIAIIMAGVLGIFGLIVAIIIGGSVSGPTEEGYTTYSIYNAWSHLAAGLCCGGTCLAAGYATGIAGEASIIAVGIRAVGNQRKKGRYAADGFEGDAARLYIAGVTILSFAGALGLYGFIVSLIIVSGSGYQCLYNE